MNIIFLRIFSRRFFSYFLVLIVVLGSPSFARADQMEAVFAGGCFWCLEHDLEDLPGVLSVESGFSGGDSLNPTYRQHGGHQEVVKVLFDSSKIMYSELLRAYWRNIDPFDGNGQFCDKGDSYRPVIFFINDVQKEEVEKSFLSAANELNKLPSNFAVDVQLFKRFWLAEDYHQDFARNNSLKYSYYRFACGRDRRLEEVWTDRAGTAREWKQE